MTKYKSLSWALAALTASALSVAASQPSIVTSNTVGFQEFNGTGGYTLTCATFIPVGSTDGGATMTLGDIRANGDFEAGVDSVVLFDGGTSLMKITFYPYDDPDEYGIPGGWYESNDFDESDEPVLLNETLLPYGMGFAFNRANISACLTYAGEVKMTDVILPSVGGYTLNGYTVPEDGKLSLLKGNEDFEAGVDSVMLFNGGASLMKITFYPYDDPDEYGIPGGWYESNDFDESDEPVLLNETPLSASIGFAFNRANSNARVIVIAPVLN